MIQKKNIYKEDVSATGEVIINHPCVVFSIVGSMETDGDAVINIADNASSYTQATRIEQICLTNEQHTVQLTYPGGKNFTAGISAITNKSGVDLSITYE